MNLWYKLLGLALRRPPFVYRKFFKIFSQEAKPVCQRSSIMTQEHPEPLCFNSRSKEPNYKFSNFYEAKIKMPEGCFNSVEHYFQAMKFIDENHSRFAVNGDLGKQGITKGNWKPEVSKGRFIKTAGSKSGTKKHKLTLRNDGLDRKRAKRKMKEGLRKKFEMEPLRSLLLETLGRPLVHTPMRGKTDYWTGRVDKNSGEIVGENNMGKLLMEVRSELQEAMSERSTEKDPQQGRKNDEKEKLLEGKEELQKGERKKENEELLEDERREGKRELQEDEKEEGKGKPHEGDKKEDEEEALKEEKSKEKNEQKENVKVKKMKKPQHVKRTKVKRVMLKAMKKMKMKEKKDVGQGGYCQGPQRKKRKRKDSEEHSEMKVASDEMNKEKEAGSTVKKLKKL